MEHNRRKLNRRSDQRKKSTWGRIKNRFNRESDNYWNTRSLKIKYENIKSRISSIKNKTVMNLWKAEHSSKGYIVPFIDMVWTFVHCILFSEGK